ncbi:hypothetical protein BESB_077450 [Besnoitia besnoiti]|uniref:Citrate transporter-like domain-containing protein n=1 Tax=Besnoitia besnoiti TaxID=94643 RepID=A0A2A9M4W6_BESBE|nr:hypothetical protein BESB_077450 [Besnoitia besnoiti]PFH33528.1 hypothetical protein BESB_077450 [Besnoitia besnoiti]
MKRAFSPVCSLPFAPQRKALGPDVVDGGPEHSDGMPSNKRFTGESSVPAWIRVRLGSVLSVRKLWLTILSAVLPLLLFIGLSPYDVKYRCLYIILVIILNWLSAANDAVVVALYPLVLCPLLGVTGVKTLAQAYFRSVSFLMIGTSLLGASFTRTGLDKTAASLILDKSGSDPAILCLALMAASCLLSMWINNASATVILCPIAGRIVSELGRRNNRRNHKPPRNQTGRVSSRAESDAPSVPVPQAEPRSTPPDGTAAVSRSSMSQETTPTSVLAKLQESKASCTSAPAGKPETTNTSQVWGASQRSVSGPVPSPSSRGTAEGSQNGIVCLRDDNGSVAASDAGKIKRGTGEFGYHPQNMRRIRNMIYIGLAYSATLGGTSTLNGSFVNPILVQLLETTYNFESSAAVSNPITVGSWMGFTLPFVFLAIFGSWLTLGKVKTAFLVGVAILVRMSNNAPEEQSSAGAPAAERRAAQDRDSSMDMEAAREAVGMEAPGSEAGECQTPDSRSRCNEETIDGNLTFAQLEVMGCLVFLIAAWLTRSGLPGGRPGWGSFFPAGYVDDSVPVIFIGILLFFLPLKAPCTRGSVSDKQDRPHPEREASTADKCRSAVRMGEDHHGVSRRHEGCERPQVEDPSRDASHSNTPESRGVRVSRKRNQRTYRPILVYAYASKHIEWGALLLLGGGFAMATAITETGLDKWLGSALFGLGNMSAPALVICIILITSSVTEIMSNTAAANVMLPILSGVTSNIPRSPLLLLLPATLGIQFAFMLPIGTAPNAIILKQGRLHPLDLFVSGLVVKVVCLCLVMLAMFTWGNVQFDVTARPLWAL